MKKVTSNVKLSQYSEKPGVKHYKGKVRVGNVETLFLIDAYDSGKYDVLLESHNNWSGVIESHELTTNFPYIKDEAKRIAHIARLELARAEHSLHPGLHFLAHPLELVVGIEYGAEDKVLFYNILTDRVSKRRV